MLGSYVSAAYQSRPAEPARRFFAVLLEWAGVKPPVTATGGEVEVQVMEAGKDRIVFAFNHGKQAVSPRISLARGAGLLRGYDLIADKEVDIVAEGSSISFTGPIPPGQVLVVHLSATPR
jgi:hypothetical protein